MAGPGCQWAAGEVQDHVGSCSAYNRYTMRRLILPLRVWPVGVVALLSAIFYVGILHDYSGPMDLGSAVRASFSVTGRLDHDGPEQLLVVIAAAMGLAAVYVAEWRMQVVGQPTWCVAMPWCMAAIAVGFLSPWYFRGTFNPGLLEALIATVVTCGLAGGARAWWAAHAA